MSECGDFLLQKFIGNAVDCFLQFLLINAFDVSVFWVFFVDGKDVVFEEEQRENDDAQTEQLGTKWIKWFLLLKFWRDKFGGGKDSFELIILAIFVEHDEIYEKGTFVLEEDAGHIDWIEKLGVLLLFSQSLRYPIYYWMHFVQRKDGIVSSFFLEEL